MGLKLAVRSLVGALALSGAVSAGAQSVSDACNLLPPTAADVEQTPQNNPKVCVGSYWQKVGKKHFGGLHEFGATVTVEPVGSPAAARAKMAGFRRGSATRNVGFGDGGLEKHEDAGAPDYRIPTPEEVKENSMYSDLTDLVTSPEYSAIFSCGSYLFYVYANPSKGPAARQLISDLEQNLRSANVCGGAAPAVTTATPTTGPVVANPPAPPSLPSDDGTTGATRYFEGKTASEIQAARASGARYLVVLNSYRDSERNCTVEERAWISDVRGSDGGRLVARVGPSISVCAGGNVVSAAQVNKSERDLKQARDELAKALARKDEIEAYIKKDPAFRTQGTAQLQKIQEWINYYDKVIAGIQQGLATSTPQF